MWHICVPLVVVAAIFSPRVPQESKSNVKKMTETEYHGLSIEIQGQKSWLELRPDGTALVYNAGVKNYKPDGFPSCRTEGKWTWVNGEKKVSGLNNSSCSWVSRHNGSTW